MKHTCKSNGSTKGLYTFTDYIFNHLIIYLIIMDLNKFVKIFSIFLNNGNL